MIVVIDANVWVSALQFGGKHTAPIRAVEKALRRDTLATSQEINAEIRRILVEKFLWSSGETERLITAYFKRAIYVTISGFIRVCRDPNDDMVLECAVLAGAQVIVSGDKDLLVMGSFRGIRIVTPAEFLAENA
ncbi:MAG: putative toxin-antitoxin system toxin component, PIN family [Terracidiphilus sp.]